MRNYSNLFADVRDNFGELSFQPRTFKRMEVKRAELVKPYLHYIDESRLTKSVDRYMEDKTAIDRMYMSTFKGSKKVNRQQLVDDAAEYYQKEFPQELTSDIFNLYHKDPAKLDFEDRTDANKFRFKILEKVIDPVARVISKDSHLKSMIMTRSMIQYLSMLMAYTKQTDEEEYEKMKQAMKGASGWNQDDMPQDDSDQGEEEADDGGAPQQNGSGAGKGKGKPKVPMTPEEALEKLMKNEKLENLQNEIMDDATKTIQNMSKLSDEELDSLYKSDAADDGQYNQETINSIINKFLSLKMNMNKVKPIIQKLLDNTRNYFTGKETVELVPFLDAESMDSIMDLELLHPKLRNFFMDDIMVKDVKREGKIDVYIDISGSMGSLMTYNDTTITGIDFAKSFAIQMVNMGLVNKVYLFDTSIYEIKATPLAITTASFGGGTSLNYVVKYIEQQGNNALVITDACDFCDTYTPLAYFIGIVGARFNSFDSEVIAKYSEKRQAIEFDGQLVYEIDKKGRRSKSKIAK